MSKTREPQTLEEWQEAADLAEFYLLLHSAVCYGLVETDVQFNLARCEELLQGAALRGIRPRADAVAQVLQKQAISAPALRAAFLTEDTGQH